MAVYLKWLFKAVGCLWGPTVYYTRTVAKKFKKINCFPKCFGRSLLEGRAGRGNKIFIAAGSSHPSTQKKIRIPLDIMSDV